MIRYLTRTSLILMTIFSFTLCKAQELVRVGSSPAALPYTFLDTRNNIWKGFIIELIDTIGDKAGFIPQYEAVQFPNQIPTLLSKNIDIIGAAVVNTQERRELVAFSDSIFSLKEALFVNVKDKCRYPSLKKLKNKVIGVQQSTVFIDLLKKKGCFKEIRQYQSVPEIIQDVAQGFIKAGLADHPVISYYLAQGDYPQVRLVKEYKSASGGNIGIVVRKGDKILVARINAAIKEIKEDGTLDDLLTKWHLKPSHSF